MRLDDDPGCRPATTTRHRRPGRSRATGRTSPPSSRNVMSWPSRRCHRRSAVHVAWLIENALAVARPTLRQLSERHPAWNSAASTRCRQDGSCRSTPPRCTGSACRRATSGVFGACAAMRLSATVQPSPVGPRHRPGPRRSAPSRGTGSASCWATIVAPTRRHRTVGEADVTVGPHQVDLGVVRIALDGDHRPELRTAPRADSWPYRPASPRRLRRSMAGRSGDRRSPLRSPRRSRPARGPESGPGRTTA